MDDVATATEWNDDAFERILEQLRTDGTVDAAGVRISREGLALILEAAPRDPQFGGHSLLRSAIFDRATFEGGASFVRVTFGGDASFDGAIFEGDVTFDWTIFNGRASFVRATFNGDASFNAVTISGDASFENVTFDADFQSSLVIYRGTTSFDDATFRGEARFFAGSFEGDANFRRSIFRTASFHPDFHGAARFDDVIFEGTVFFAADFKYAGFPDATFKDVVHWFSMRCETASFHGATFERAREFGPVVADNHIDLDRTVFVEPVTIEASGRTLSCARAQFRGGADLLVRRVEVTLENADFGASSMLTSARGPMRGEEREAVAGDEDEAALGEEREAVTGEEEATDGQAEVEAPPREDSLRRESRMPRVVSLRGAKVGHLTISNADVRPCRFEGAHGLDRLRLESVGFAQTPLGWHPTRRWRLPIRWTRRQVIAEEHQWRAQVARSGGWYGREVQASTGPQSAAPPPAQIAAIYRALRKGREDNKDEPGAADFYYGEMEMRRQRNRQPDAKRAPGGPHSRQDQGDPPIDVEAYDDAAVRSTTTSERVILSLYWLVSGYGLRASRALVALAITVALGAVSLDLWGFEAEKQPDDGALLFAAETSISLLRAPETELTPAGHVIQIMLRLTGPLLFGFALLALRGRVKR